jgi:hypothetical protein
MGMLYSYDIAPNLEFVALRRIEAFSWLLLTLTHAAKMSPRHPESMEYQAE